jgi:hypothetical protein
LRREATLLSVLWIMWTTADTVYEATYENQDPPEIVLCTDLQDPPPFCGTNQTEEEEDMK